jgi:hypothetical protein
MNLDFSRSLFLETQVPQYIRNEYPLFVEFLKQYYSYLDRSVGQLIAVKIENPGKNYSSTPSISLQILDTDPNSATFGDYIADTKGATLTPYIVSGRIVKIRVTSFGSGYTKEDAPRIVITDGSGSGAVVTPVIVTNVGNINQATKQVIRARDIDDEFEILKNYILEEFAPNFPKELFSTQDNSVEISKFVKFIKQFYNASGIEDSITFLYRILFNTSVNYYYPKNDMLRVSDGRWNIDTITRIVPDPSIPSYDDFVQLYSGARIVSGCGCSSIIQKIVDLGTGEYELTLSNVHQDFQSPTGVNNLFNYPITGRAERIGNTVPTPGKGVIYQSDGYYIGDRGQPSSSKRIQDSYYYQDFSYELQSDSSIKEFKNLLEEIIHPAGFIYFIRLNLEAAIDGSMELTSDAETNYGITKDSERIGVLSPQSDNLGPIYSDVNYWKNIQIPQNYIDITNSTNIFGATAISATGATGYYIDVNNSSLTLSEDYINYSVILTQNSTTWYDRVYDYYPDTGRIVVGQLSPAPSGDPLTYRIIQNYRIAAINTSTRTITLSPLDPNRYVPYTPIAVSTLAVGATSAVGATGLRLNTSDNFNIRVGDVIRINSEDLLVNYIVGSSGVFNISATRGHNSTTPAVHAPGATAFNKTDHRYLGWRIYITSGPAAGQFSKITAYGATGAITYSSAFTLHAAGATAPTTSSTYLLYPDFAGTNNDGYYTTGATGISELVIASAGIGATGATGVSIQIDPPPYGISAGATGVLTNGVLTSVTITNSGSGYIFSPTVTVNYIGGSTGPISQTLVYANINQTTSTPAENYYEYSALRGVILGASGISDIFVQANTSNTFGPNGEFLDVEIMNPGSGYISVPTFYLKDSGDGVGALFNVEGATGPNGLYVSGVNIDNLGNSYSTATRIIFEEPTIKIGERIYQSSTGARGVVEYFDKDTSEIYVLKDMYSTEFSENSPISYNNIDININSIRYYKTSGKSLSGLSESEIDVI